MITDLSINLNEPPESNTIISVLNNRFNDSETRSVINESENELLKIKIEMLKSKIDILKSQLFSFEVIQENDSLINYYTGLPNKETIIFFKIIFKNTHITYFSGWNVERIPKNDQILMTLMKLRLNLDFIDSGVRFGCSRKQWLTLC